MALVFRLASEMPPKEKVMQATIRTNRQVSELARKAGLRQPKVIYLPMVDTVSCSQRALGRSRLYVGEDLIVNAPPDAVAATVAHEFYHLKKRHALVHAPLKWAVCLCKKTTGKRPQWISGILKKSEYRADRFSASLVGKDANIAALNYFMRDPKSLVPSPYSHPTVGQRLSALGKLAD